MLKKLIVICSAIAIACVMASTGRAQTTGACQASGSLPMEVLDSADADVEFQYNEDGTISVFITNTSSRTPVSTGTKVPAILKGTLTVTLACQDAACASPLPGLYVFNPSGSAVNGCEDKDAGVSGCELDGLDPNKVKITMTAGGVDLAASETKLVATIRVQAAQTVDVTVFTRADSGANDIETNSGLCTSVAKGGAQGSTTSTVPPVCGDGYLDLEAGEECDDGNDVPYDGCGTPDNSCAICQDSTPCPDTGEECWDAGCDDRGFCDQQHTPVQASTACTDTGNECADAGCDGEGNCDQLHTPVQASTACTDTGNECADAGCDGEGNCDQLHTPVQASTACTDTGYECADAGCDGEGNCDQLHNPVQASTACTDTGNECYDAGCDGRGSCDQLHAPVVCQDPTDPICNEVICDEQDGCIERPIDPVPAECLDEEICRTPGYWGTHAGTEKGARNITKTVIDECGGCLEVCGDVITNTNLKDADSSVEAMCVSVNGSQRLQLVRQLTAAALNCCISGSDDTCNGISINEIYDACNTVCAASGGVEVEVDGHIVNCISAIDCFNNGGRFNNETGACQYGTCSISDAACGVGYDACPTGETCEPLPGNCHDREFGICPNGDLCDFETPCADGAKCSSPAGSSKKCNDASNNDCKVVGILKGCETGTNGAESCPAED